MCRRGVEGIVLVMLDTLRFVTEAALASPWLLAVIFVLAVVDAVVPMVPSEALIMAAGVASVTGEQNLLAVIAVAAAGAFVGEVVGYLVGRGIGPGLRSRLTSGGSRAAAFDRIAGLLDRHGGPVLLTARFLPSGRTVATLAAGATGYPVPRFLGFTAAGAPLSATYQAMLGFVGGAAFTHDTVTALLVSFGLACTVTLVVEAGRRLRSHRRRPAQRVMTWTSRVGSPGVTRSLYGDSSAASSSGVNPNQWSVAANSVGVRPSSPKR